MENNIQQKNQTKTQLSLAALMFFSPLVQNMIKKNNLWLSIDDIKFIKWYIKLWYFAIILLIITIISWVTSYQTNALNIETIYTISITITIIILCIWTLAILTNKDILSWDTQLLDVHQEHITTNKTEIILQYLPLYNIYLRYKEHNFEKPNLLLKESILIRIIFCIVWLTTTIFWTSAILIFIILRIASLIWEIDIIWPQIKTYINDIFNKNPEEIRWYISWSIKYLINKIKWNKEITNTDYKSTIKEEKESLSLLYNIQLHNSIHIKTQYILFITTIILWIIYIQPNFSLRTTTIPAIIIVWRYVLMFIRRKHLPALPIFKEITDLLTYILEKIQPVILQIRNYFNNK